MVHVQTHPAGSVLGVLAGHPRHAASDIPVWHEQPPTGGPAAWQVFVVRSQLPLAHVFLSVHGDPIPSWQPCLPWVVTHVQLQPAGSFSGLVAGHPAGHGSEPIAVKQLQPDVGPVSTTHLPVVSSHLSPVPSACVPHCPLTHGAPRSRRHPCCSSGCPSLVTLHRHLQSGWPTGGAILSQDAALHVSPAAKPRKHGQTLVPPAGSHVPCHSPSLMLHFPLEHWTGAVHGAWAAKTQCDKCRLWSVTHEHLHAGSSVLAVAGHWLGVVPGQVAE